jgi:hypothetical protein
MIKSWKTSLLGAGSILLGLWVLRVVYVPNNTLYFNICYVWPGAFSLIVAGIGLIHAKDHDQ